MLRAAVLITPVMSATNPRQIVWALGPGPSLGIPMPQNPRPHLSGPWLNEGILKKAPNHTRDPHRVHGIFLN